MRVKVFASNIYDENVPELTAVIEIDDCFKTIDVPLNESPNVPDDFYLNCLKACHDRLSKKFNNKNFYYQIDGVESLETGNTMAER